MMNPKTLFSWFYEQGCSYNLFVLEENDYNDDEPRDPSIVLKQQKYTTWLYVFLLIMSLYVLFYITLMKPQSQTVTVFDITSAIFNQLNLEHAATLSCPCSTITVPYKDFVSNTITFHPVCSSIFIDPKWIQALYLLNASTYGVTDFRTTANAQFQLLSSLCSLSQDIVFQNQIDFDNNEFLTIYLLNEIQVQSEVFATVELFKNSISTRIISFLNYIRTSTRANYLVSALNTNIMISAYRSGSRYSVRRLETLYYLDISDGSLSTMIVCGSANSISPAGFYSTLNLTIIFEQALWVKPTKNSKVVNGFFGGCTPLESLLKSTLDCLYNINCLELLTNYFPALNQTNFNLTNSVLTSKQQTITLYDHLIDLFIEERSTKINYSKYFDNCRASFCTYTTIDKTNFSYAVTLFISLYGGLIIILRLVAPFLIDILWKLKHSCKNTNIDYAFCRTNIHIFAQSMKRLNLFKAADDRTEDSIKQQRIITRVYLILLTGSFLVLLFFTSLSTQTVTISVSNPSLVTFNNLQDLYSNTLRCPCSTTTIPYNNFVSLSPVLHQVCSSDFVSRNWILIVKNATDYKSIDWRNRACPQFQLLSDLCQLAKKTIDDAIHDFLLQSFISSSVLFEFDFNTQLNATINQFFQSTIISYALLVDTVDLLIQVDQPFMEDLGSSWRLTTDENLIANGIINGTNNQQILKLKFVLLGTRDVASLSVDCICGTNPYCQSPVAIYDIDHAWHSVQIVNVSYIVPGSIVGCSTFDSLLLSTLECFYSDSYCFSILINYIKMAYIQNVEYSSWFDVRPLVYKPTLSNYPPKTPISMIVKNMMIEQLNPSSSYNKFYELCAPSYCTYSQRIRTKTIVGVMIALVSMIGGLIVSLRLLTPHVVKFIFNLLPMITKKQQQQQQAVRLKLFDRIKMIVQNLITVLYNTAINLNIFAVRDFESNINREKAKRLGQLATRLYIVLFISGLIILLLYTIVQPYTITKTFDKPSFDSYNHLIQNYGDKLKCSCSLIASTYNHFLNIEAKFHQICSSLFASNQWRTNFQINLASDLSIYTQRDYRRFLSSHLQFLNGLCKLSIQSVNNSIEQFLSSLFITTQLLSENNFHDRLILLIEESKSNAPIIFNRLLSLIQNINHGNRIVSKYGSNYEYISPWFTSTTYPYAFTQSIIYDNGCSCELYSNCTIEANIIKINSSEKIPLKGLKMGCTPSESFRASTLECFYDQLCVNLIKNSINYTNNISSLSIITINRFLINTTINELINNLFIEEWITTMNYSSYFKQCSPLLCTYSYIQQYNLLYTITILFGLQGGLTIVLKWISPRIIRILLKLYQYRKNTVQPLNSSEMNSIHIVTLTTSQLESVPTNATSETNFFSQVRRCFKIVLICLLIVIIITGLIIFSIYVARVEQNEQILTISSTSQTVNIISNTTITTTTITITNLTTHLPACQLKFQATTKYRTGSTAGLKSPIAADLNGDNRSDVVFYNYQRDSVHVLLGNGNGTFSTELLSWGGRFSGWSIIITIGDFNNDNKLDLAFVNINSDNVTLMLGNGNGTFEAPIKLSTGPNSYPTGITAFDFNGDSYLDIAVANNWDSNVGVILGNGNGTFSAQTKYYTGLNSYPASIATGDFNGDNYQDIIVSNFYNRYIGIFLGHGNGTFQEQKTSFAGGFFYPYFIAVGDMNGDRRTDLVFSTDTANTVSVLYGYGNGTLGARERFVSGNRTYYPRIAVGDFNCDDHLDIIVGSIRPFIVYVLVGDGNGYFEAQAIFSTNITGSYTWVGVGDFNGDNCPDIIATDDTAGSIDILMNTCECCTAAFH